MVIYLDESGDLGFVQGGSDFFVITFIAVPESKHLKRIVRNIKKARNLPVTYEFHGSKTPKATKIALLQSLSGADIEVHCIVMKKANVMPHLRNDENILYNYVVCSVLVPYIIALKSVSIVLDRRILKVASAMELEEYLNYRVRYEEQADVKMHIQHADSITSLGIQAVDVICNSIFKKYELRDSSYYDLISGKIRPERRLYFGQ